MFKTLKKILNKVLFFLPDYLIGNLCFEAMSFVGRFFSTKLVLKGDKNYINLGSGPKIVRGCINIDFFTTPGIDYGADLRYPLKIANNSIDGIFCEHALEHLTYNHVDNLLKECNRIMKPGAYIRIVLPDLSLFMKNYVDKNNDWFMIWESLMFINSSDKERRKRRMNTNLQAISFVTQEYGHVSSWDVETISFYLKRNNFCDIGKCGFRQGHDEKLLIDQNEEDRKFVSLYIEGMKSKR